VQIKSQFFGVIELILMGLVKRKEKKKKKILVVFYSSFSK